ncbi:MAG TPA: ABC transporter substrate-binding protein [Pseudolabrys sp.]|nr:ABC transporter substrate-binding protein [Pseudolabrys sp.]
MIRRLLAAAGLLALLIVPAAAQERVTIGTRPLIDNGALFLAAAHGYFKAVGLDVDMTAYKSDKDVVDAVALGATDFGLAGFTPAAFSHAGRGLIKAVAAQVEEKHGYEGNEIVASNMAYAKGLRGLDNLAGNSVAITRLGSAFHYQLGQIAGAKKFDFKSIVLKPLQTIDDMARAVGTNKVDAAILPSPYARELLLADQAKLVGWYSEVGEQQLGALFANSKVIETKRAVVEKFVRAYRRGAADYAQMVRYERGGKRVANVHTREIATIIARYVYPGRPLGEAATTVEAGGLPMDPQARLDLADIGRQIEWLKTQGLIDKSVEPSNVVDTSFSK